MTKEEYLKSLGFEETIGFWKDSKYDKTNCYEYDEWKVLLADDLVIFSEFGEYFFTMTLYDDKELKFVIERLNIL